jgi:hypothetical protein
MHIPLLFRSKSSITDSPDALQSLLQRGLTKATQCRLLTRMRSGQCHARAVRLFGWSQAKHPSLWFVIPRQTQLASGIRSVADVMVEISDPSLSRAILVGGQAKLVESRHEPVYLHPSVRSASVRIDSDPLDFVFLRVEVRPADEVQAFSHAASLAAA